MMIWRDIILSQKLDKNRLVNALASVFPAQDKEICVADEIEHVEGNYKVICIFSELSGYYCSMLSFYLEFTLPDEIESIVKICQHLDCEALISDDENINPYAMILLSKDRVIRKVKIDPKKLDYYEKYEILEIV